MKRVNYVIGLAALVLAGCATVSNERVQLVEVQRGFYTGVVYELRTRDVDGPTGQYETTSVVYKGLSRTCTDARDCDAKARRLIEEYDERTGF